MALGRPAGRFRGHGKGPFLRALRMGPVLSTQWPEYFGSRNSMKTTISHLRDDGYVIAGNGRADDPYVLESEPKGFCPTCGRC